MSGARRASASLDLVAAALSCARSRLPTSGISRSMMNFSMSASLQSMARAALCAQLGRFTPAWQDAPGRLRQTPAFERVAGEQADQMRGHEDDHDHGDQLDRGVRHERRSPEVARPALAPVGERRDRERGKQDGEGEARVSWRGSERTAWRTPVGSGRQAQGAGYGAGDTHTSKHEGDARCSTT